MLPSVAQSNPFYQPAKQWQIRIFALLPHILAIEEAFGDLALATASFEINESTTEWAIDVLTDVPPENMDLRARLALISGLLGIPCPSFEVKPIEPRDWVSEVGQSFPPLHVGRFYVYGSHIAAMPPQGKIALRISAGAAFGSGEHATTSGCLRALGTLARKRRFLRTLDMGCGSGILAIAMAKLWRAPVVGIDVDPVSVSVARENAALNRVRGLVRFEANDGYRGDAVRKKAPFDLIVANILARPLMRMAPQLAQNLVPGGAAILSGLLSSQARMVLATHRLQGLELVSHLTHHGWSTLILSKGNNLIYKNGATYLLSGAK
jgi:ribosomal protein L11 methyltransferase